MDPIRNQVTWRAAGRTTAPKIPLLALSSLVAAAWLSSTGSASPKPSVGEARSQHLSDRGATELRTILNVAKLAALDDERLTTFADQAQELYTSTDHSLVWIHDGRLTPQAREVLNRLQHAEEKGLDPNDYNGRFGSFRFASPEIPGRPSESDLIRFDVALTLATMRYLSDLHLGRANPKSPPFAMEVRGKTLDLPSFY